jgi:hypothetical protein
VYKRQAVACLHRKLHDLDVGANIALTLYLYSAIVEPSLLYGCEVWGQQCLHLSDPADSSNLAVEQVHRNFLRYVLRLSRNTSAWIGYRESGMYPVQHNCLRKMLSFLSRILQLDDREYAKLAMLECIADTTMRGVRMNWYFTLQQMLARVSQGVFDDPSTIDVAAGRVEVDLCMIRWREYYYTKVWGGLAADPRTAPSSKVTLCTYHSWFAADLPADGAHWRCAPCITAPTISYPHLIELIKFRTSNHKLAIQRLRRAHVPRASRVCTLCGSGAVQDECHILFDCPHLTHARLQYGTLFDGPGEMRAACTDPGLAAALASFVHQHCVITD